MHLQENIPSWPCNDTEKVAVSEDELYWFAASYLSAIKAFVPF